MSTDTRMLQGKGLRETSSSIPPTLRQAKEALGNPMSTLSPRRVGRRWVWIARALNPWGHLLGLYGFFFGFACVLALTKSSGANPTVLLVLLFCFSVWLLCLEKITKRLFGDPGRFTESPLLDLSDVPALVGPTYLRVRGAFPEVTIWKLLRVANPDPLLAIVVLEINSAGGAQEVLAVFAQWEE